MRTQSWICCWISPGVKPMMVEMNIGFITRGFTGPNIRSGLRSNWSRYSLPVIYTGMATRAFGIPAFAPRYDGNYCLPEKSGALYCRDTIKGQGSISDADLHAIGNLIKTLSGVGGMSFCNLREGRWISANLLGLGVLDAPLMAPATIEALIRIGASPSAEDIVFALMDTNTGGIEGSITLRQAIKVLLSVAAGKTSITDLGGGNATVVFRNVDDTKDVVTANMEASERKSVVVDRT